ncbi:molecular chaperone MKKS-like [Babylonia areolata]|uniref:molecular chaperone MKKS-like n=1 Tax=Babylonia areolata TaxID=304850 RepID=UPI003FD47880
MGSRQERGVESQVVRQTLDDPQVVAALHALSQVVDRARGPHGQIQPLHNNVGGPVTMTTCSSRLLSALSLSRPCLRLIESAVQGHLKTHHDGGLLTTSLCLHLVLNAVKLESVGRVCVREVYGEFLDLVGEYLNAENCPIVVTVDTSNLKVMMGYVQNIISPKPVCSLRPASASHISRLLLKAFLISVPDTAQSFFSDRVYMLQSDRTDLLSSQVFEGLLLEWPEMCAQLGPQELALPRGASHGVKVVLVNVSMSGDAEEILTNQMEAQHHVIQLAADHVMTRMLVFCDWLVELGVGVLLCQKVVHPKVKAYLRQRGVLFVERLGLQPVSYIQDLTGASVISSVLVRPGDGVCGLLTGVDHQVLHGKSYLHLHRAGSCVSTLLLCAPAEQQVAELMCAVKSAMAGLCSTFQRPHLLCGGGCWLVHLAFYLRHQVRKQSDELCTKLSVTKSQLQTSAGAFISSLEAAVCSLLGTSFQAWVDARHWHVWHAPPGVDLTTEKQPFSCACGMLSSGDVDRDSLHLLQTADTCQPGRDGGGSGGGVKTRRLEIGEGVNCDWLVLDTQDCAVSAVHTAVMTAVTVLSFTQFIHDLN